MDLGLWVKRSFLYYADNIAVIYEGKQLTYKELSSRTYKLGNALLKMGLKKGDKVAILAYNCSQLVELEFALAITGLVKVPVNTRLSDKEYLYILNDSEANTLFIGEEFADVLNKIRNETKQLRNLICFKKRENFIDYEEMINTGSDEEPNVKIEENDYYRILYTSGTTGIPKGVLHSHKNMCHTLYNILIEGNYTSEDVMLHVGAFTHATINYLWAHIIRGGKNVIEKRFDVKGFLENVEKERVTSTMVVPTMITMILEYADLRKYNTSSLQRLIYGASPMSAKRLKEALKIFGPILMQVYGQTEAPHTITTLNKEDHKRILNGKEEDLKIANSAGRPFVGVEVKIVDDKGEEVRRGGVGEIVVKSEHVMVRYWNNEEATKETLKDGWVFTRDMGYFDDKGYLYIVDRKSDMIVSGGFNIYPKEVEEIIELHPAVSEVAVIGVPDEKWGESVKAVVVLKKGAGCTEEEIMNDCKEKLPGFKRPKSVKIVSELPRNTYGKIERKKLKEEYWRGLERRVH